MGGRLEKWGNSEAGCGEQEELEDLAAGLRHVFRAGAFFR